MRLLVIRSTAPPAPSLMLDTSWSIFSRMVLPALICGVMPRVRPTSLRSTVWNGLVTPWPVPVLVYWPVMKGTSWPTWISASSLSMVISEGVDRTLVLESPDRALSSTAKLVPSSLNWPMPRFRPCWIRPRGEPSPASPGIACSVLGSRMLAEATRSSLNTATSTPSSRERSMVTSAMIASTRTWPRRMSSWLTTSRTSRMMSAGAVTTRALASGSAMIRTSPLETAPPSPPPPEVWRSVKVLSTSASDSASA